jgi:light-regulated signal transduction histidine kinase (bacteriophytochrome)
LIYNKILETKNKELEQFVYIASHDLQEPLQTVQDFTTLVYDKFKETIDDETDRYFNFIFGANQRMRSLITGLLNYGLIGKKEIKQTVDCNKLINDVITDLGSSLKNSNVIFNCEKLPVIECHPSELRLLFQNLISNAIKFRKKDVNPIITIAARRKLGYWEFYVKDNGIGISDKHKEKVFVIFQRLHSRDKFDGAGIGLAHCKKIIELHGGDIWLESEESKGSTFYFTIPA